METKRCSTCKEERSVDFFYSHPRTRDKRQSRCRLCAKEASRRLRAKQRAGIIATERICQVCEGEFLAPRIGGVRYTCSDTCQKELARRKRHRANLAKYGLTQDSFTEMLRSQDFLCYICDVPFDFSRARSVHIDHCHETGRLRKLLCNKCNVGLGQYNDRADLLHKAARYLEEHLALR